MLKIILVILLLYLLLNSVIVRKNANAIDAVYKAGCKNLGWSFPKCIVFIVFLFSAIFIFGFKNLDYGSSNELDNKVNEVIRENNPDNFI